MSSFRTLLAASRISPSEEMNSVYTTSAPCSLHRARKGGSLTSSMGARSKGKSGSSMSAIRAKSFFLDCKSTKYPRTAWVLIGFQAVPLLQVDGPLVVLQAEVPEIEGKAKADQLGCGPPSVEIVLVQVVRLVGGHVFPQYILSGHGQDQPVVKKRLAEPQVHVQLPIRNIGTEQKARDIGGGHLPGKAPVPGQGEVVGQVPIEPIHLIGIGDIAALG